MKKNVQDWWIIEPEYQIKKISILTSDVNLKQKRCDLHNQKCHFLKNSDLFDPDPWRHLYNSLQDVYTDTSILLRKDIHKKTCLLHDYQNQLMKIILSNIEKEKYRAK